jgi:hypothetical protein
MDFSKNWLIHWGLIFLSRLHVFSKNLLGTPLQEWLGLAEAGAQELTEFNPKEDSVQQAGAVGLDKETP